jgi:hypothetical protein
VVFPWVGRQSAGLIHILLISLFDRSLNHL